MTKKQERLAVLVFGVAFLVVMLLIAIWVPNPTRTQYETFKVVLALAAAGVAAFIPGLLQVEVPRMLRASGSLAVFALLYLNTPAQVAVAPPQIAAPPSNIVWHAHGRVVDAGAGATVPLAGAEIWVAEDANAHTTSRADGTFDVDVSAPAGGHVLFRVAAPGRSEFTKLVAVGTGFVELWEQKP